MYDSNRNKVGICFMKGRGGGGWHAIWTSRSTSKHVDANPFFHSLSTPNKFLLKFCGELSWEGWPKIFTTTFQDGKSPNPYAIDPYGFNVNLGIVSIPPTYATLQFIFATFYCSKLGHIMSKPCSSKRVVALSIPYFLKGSSKGMFTCSPSSPKFLHGGNKAK